MEIWKDIPNYDGAYQSSNLGNIKSLKLIKERVLKPALSNSYLVVSLSKNNKQKTYKVSQLVAMAFLNYKLNGHKIIVDHINNNKLDNKLENLQLISHRENLSKDKWRKNTSSKYTGVSWHKFYKKWQSQIMIKGKFKHLGYFYIEIDAHNAYQNELKIIKP